MCLEAICSIVKTKLPSNISKEDYCTRLQNLDMFDTLISVFEKAGNGYDAMDEDIQDIESEAGSESDEDNPKDSQHTLNFDVSNPYSSNHNGPKITCKEQIFPKLLGLLRECFPDRLENYRLQMQNDDAVCRDLNNLGMGTVNPCDDLVNFFVK